MSITTILGPTKRNVGLMKAMILCLMQLTIFREMFPRHLTEVTAHVIVCPTHIYLSA